MMTAILRLSAAAVLAAALLGSTAHADPSAVSAPVDTATPASAQPTAGLAGTLVFSDEFTGSALDTAKWKVRDQERTETGRTDGIRWCGTLEARVHVPPRKGHLGAVWLQTYSWGNITGSAEDGAEIDLLESAYATDRLAVTKTDGEGWPGRGSVAA